MDVDVALNWVRKRLGRKDAVVHLGKLINISPGMFALWRKRYGGQIPELYARRLDEISNGELPFIHAEYGLIAPARISRAKSMRGGRVNHRSAV